MFNNLLRINEIQDCIVTRPYPMKNSRQFPSHSRTNHQSQQPSQRIKTDISNSNRQMNQTFSKQRKIVRMTQPSIFFNLKPHAPKKTAFEEYINLLTKTKNQNQNQNINKFQVLTQPIESQIYCQKEFNTTRKKFKERIEMRPFINRSLPQKISKIDSYKFDEIQPWDTSQQSTNQL